PQTVTYHEACHLCHGQKIIAQPRQVLGAVPNLKLVELPESTWCCGSAGIYNLVQPEMANELLERKLKYIKSTNAEVVATGNPGCLLQIINGAKRAGLKLRVVHPQKTDQVLPLSEALIAGGVIAIEITMTTPNAIEAIRGAKKTLGDRGLIGVGTVLDVLTCRAAIEAGAEFVVSPILRPELVAPCRAADKPIMLGAYTPTEAQLGHEAGADFIKIFPSDGLGPN